MTAGVVMKGLAETLGLPLNLVEPLLKIHDRGAESDDHQPQSLAIGDSPSRPWVTVSVTCPADLAEQFTRDVAARYGYLSRYDRDGVLNVTGRPGVGLIPDWSDQ